MKCCINIFRCSSQYCSEFIKNETGNVGLSNLQKREMKEKLQHITTPIKMNSERPRRSAY